MPARVAQIGSEVLALEPAGFARTAAIAAEVLSEPNAGFARTALIAVEVLHSLNAVDPVTGGTGAWFKVLEGDIFTDRDLVD